MKKFLVALAVLSLVAGVTFADTTNTITNAYGLVITVVSGATGVKTTSVTPANDGTSAGVTAAPNSSTSIALADGKVLIGDAYGRSAAKTLSGDATISREGVVALGTGVIVDADVKTNAAITATKLAGGTVDNTEFGYLNGVTSAIQTQLGNKQPLDTDLTTIAAKTLTMTTLTNVVYNGATGSVNVVTWANP